MQIITRQFLVGLVFVMLIELRCQKTDGSIGLQTIVPPSTHKETGKEIRS
jgi:hypothetical protein